MKLGTVARTVAVAAAIAGAMATSVGGAMLGAGGTALAAPAAATCANNQLTITPMTSNDGMGHASLMFRIHDRQSAACTLYGYPGAKLLDKNSNPLPTHVSWGPWPEGGPKPKLVTLSRGHDAYFVLSWEQIPTGSEPCPVASHLLVTAPNDRQPVRVNGFKGGLMVCGGKLMASPVAAKKFWK